MIFCARRCARKWSRAWSDPCAECIMRGVRTCRTDVCAGVGRWAWARPDEVRGRVGTGVLCLFGRCFPGDEVAGLNGGKPVGRGGGVPWGPCARTFAQKSPVPPAEAIYRVWESCHVMVNGVPSRTTVRRAWRRRMAVRDCGWIRVRVRPVRCARCDVRMVARVRGDAFSDCAKDALRVSCRRFSCGKKGSRGRLCAHCRHAIDRLKTFVWPSAPNKECKSFCHPMMGMRVGDRQRAYASPACDAVGRVPSVCERVVMCLRVSCAGVCLCCAESYAVMRRACALMCAGHGGCAVRSVRRTCAVMCGRVCACVSTRVCVMWRGPSFLCAMVRRKCCQRSQVACVKAWGAARVGRSHKCARTVMPTVTMGAGSAWMARRTVCHHCVLRLR